LGVPVDELTNTSVSLDALLPRARVAEALERLQEAADDEARVAVVADVLLQLPFARDRAVSLAIERLIRPDGPAPVAAVARELGLSERQLERRFRARVGLTPKRFASLARFERAVTLAKGMSTLAQVAAAAGYFDQSHLSRDFRRFAGGAPTRLRTG
jgi:transcriptional regulator GlxA family with amidase domain